MKRRRQMDEGPGAFELIEEAFHLVRIASPSTLGCYLIGTLPFVLGLLYFWADMSRSAFAAERLGPASLVMALLFLWMKCWQSVFARRLLSTKAGQNIVGPRTSWYRLVAAQGFVQATGLVLWPLALLLLLPFGWVNAFYQSFTVLGSAEDGRIWSGIKAAARQSHLWVTQNHIILLIFKGFWLFVCLNWITALMAIPYLLKVLAGIETPFTQSLLAVFNSTFFAAAAALTYISTDPLHKAIYALRCFYGSSVRTGQDLRSELKQAGMLTQRAAAVAVLAAMFTCTGAASEAASKAAQPAQAPVVRPENLDHSIEQVLQKREYSWRLPRGDKSREEAGLLEGFLHNVSDTISRWLKAALRWFANLMQRLIGFFRPMQGPGGAGIGWLAALRALTFLLLVALACLIGVLLFRFWQRRYRPSEDLSTASRAVPPDLTDENVAADQMPEDEWVKLGRELLQRGELRLAIRAFYLASLAHLANQNLITIARFKSNRDYQLELARRAHALPQIAEVFAENVSIFDRIWYGLHEVNAGIVSEFEGNLQRIKTGGASA